MTLISIVCLLALSSVALARPYGGYGAQPMQQTLIRRPIIQTFQPELSGYGQIEVQQTQPRQVGYGQSFISQRTSVPLPQPPMPLPQPPMPLPLTRADLICRGKLPETVIVMEDKRGVFVCLDDSKGEEILCQPGLWYHEGLRRCERTLGPIPNACESQPCLNGGQCFQDGSHYQCQCAPGFDGTICELDARVCQTQQPCGSQPGTRCQSFRPNAALEYICVHQNGFAYGFNAQQVVPSPCTGIDGAVALSITDKGIAYCDGDRLSLESCVEKTHWDDQIKACIWDDETIPGTIPSPVVDTFIGSKTILPSRSSYGEQLPLSPPKMIESYGEKLQLQQRPKMVESFGEQLQTPPKMVESYGEQLTLQQRPKMIESFGEQLSLQQRPKLVESFNTIPQQQKLVESYGEQLPLQQRPKFVESYGEQLSLQQRPKLVESFNTIPQQQRVHSFNTIPQQQQRVNTFGTLLPSPQKVNSQSDY